MTLVAIGLVLLPTTLGLLTGSSSEQRVLAFTTLAFSAFVMRAPGNCRTRCSHSCGCAVSWR